MERKLATVRMVSNVEAIPGADNIEVITVDGWKVVAQKNEFPINSMCVYCEVDSFLPIKPEYEFLRKSSYKKMSDGTEGFRLKTIRLRGQVSQGLLLPMSVIPDTYYLADAPDLSELLGIVKYEPPIPAELAGKVKGNFPSFIQKTDEERIQNLTSDYDKMKSHIYYVTEKLDGSSSTFYLRDGVFGVCSRNLDLLETEGNTFWRLAREMDLENKFKAFGSNIALQGECIGESIQKNRYKLKGQTIRFFNGFDIDHYQRLDYLTFRNVIDIMGLETVPIEETQFHLPDTIEELIVYADAKSILNPNTNREGVVIRSLDMKISFKVISNEFLLKNE